MWFFVSSSEPLGVGNLPGESGTPKVGHPPSGWETRQREGEIQGEKERERVGCLGTLKMGAQVPVRFLSKAYPQKAQMPGFHKAQSQSPVTSCASKALMSQNHQAFNRSKRKLRGTRGTFWPNVSLRSSACPCRSQAACKHLSPACCFLYQATSRLRFESWQVSKRIGS